jgi:hypothetical protein
MKKMKWVSVKDRLPDEYRYVFIRCIYQNGNECMAVGSIIDGTWEIEWSDNHPDKKDVAFWLDY